MTRTEMLISWGFKNESTDEDERYIFKGEGIQILWNETLEIGCYDYEGELGIFPDFYSLAQTYGDFFV